MEIDGFERSVLGADLVVSGPGMLNRVVVKLMGNGPAVVGVWRWASTGCVVKGAAVDTCIRTDVFGKVRTTALVRKTEKSEYDCIYYAACVIQFHAGHIPMIDLYLPSSRRQPTSSGSVTLAQQIVASVRQEQAECLSSNLAAFQTW